jgi:hypothetical protein
MAKVCHSAAWNVDWRHLAISKPDAEKSSSYGARSPVSSGEVKRLQVGASESYKLHFASINANFNRSVYDAKTFFCLAAHDHLDSFVSRVQCLRR